MNQIEVINLMESSKTKKQWNKNTRTVKKDNFGILPSWWYARIIKSGVLTRTNKRWRKI